MSLVQLPDRRLRLVFFGTPDIARTVLEGLLAANEDDVVLTVCQPDRPKGRGKKVEPPPVKVAAEAAGIEVVQPTRLKNGKLAARLKDLNADLGVVVAYGRILPDDLFQAPAFHTWNVHASLLPRHRGASPIQHAILEGDRQTGVTLMVVSTGLDEGPMLLTRAMDLCGRETAGSLTESLAGLGAAAIVEGLREAKRSGLTVTPQPESGATYAPLIEKGRGELAFDRPAVELDRAVRAFDPWPGTFVRMVDGQPLKILSVRALPDPGSFAPGTVREVGARLVVQTQEGCLEIERLQPPGKRPMAAADYLRGTGRNIRIGDPFPGC